MWSGEYSWQCSSPRTAKVHFNSVDGKAVFNWRMAPSSIQHETELKSSSSAGTAQVYPRIKMPSWSCTMTVSLHHHERLACALLFGRGAASTKGNRLAPYWRKRKRLKTSAINCEADGRHVSRKLRPRPGQVLGKAIFCAFTAAAPSVFCLRQGLRATQTP